MMDPPLHPLPPAIEQQTSDGFDQPVFFNDDGNALDNHHGLDTQLPKAQQLDTGALDTGLDNGQPKFSRISYRNGPRQIAGLDVVDFPSDMVAPSPNNSPSVRGTLTGAGASRSSAPYLNFYIPLNVATPITPGRVQDFRSTAQTLTDVTNAHTRLHEAMDAKVGFAVPHESSLPRGLGAARLGGPRSSQKQRSTTPSAPVPQRRQSIATPTAGTRIVDGMRRTMRTPKPPLHFDDPDSLTKKKERLAAADAERERKLSELEDATSDVDEEEEEEEKSTAEMNSRDTKAFAVTGGTPRNKNGASEKEQSRIRGAALNSLKKKAHAVAITDNIPYVLVPPEPTVAQPTRARDLRHLVAYEMAMYNNEIELRNEEIKAHNEEYALFNDKIRADNKEVMKGFAAKERKDRAEAREDLKRKRESVIAPMATPVAAPEAVGDQKDDEDLEVGVQRRTKAAKTVKMGSELATIPPMVEAPTSATSSSAFTLAPYPRKTLPTPNTETNGEASEDTDVEMTEVEMTDAEQPTIPSLRFLVPKASAFVTGYCVALAAQKYAKYKPPTPKSTSTQMLPPPLPKSCFSTPQAAQTQNGTTPNPAAPPILKAKIGRRRRTLDPWPPRHAKHPDAKPLDLNGDLQAEHKVLGPWTPGDFEMPYLSQRLAIIERKEIDADLERRGITREALSKNYQARMEAQKRDLESQGSSMEAWEKEMEIKNEIGRKLRVQAQTMERVERKRVEMEGMEMEMREEAEMEVGKKRRAGGARAKGKDKPVAAQGERVGLGKMVADVVNDTEKVGAASEGERMEIDGEVGQGSSSKPFEATSCGF